MTKEQFFSVAIPHLTDECQCKGKYCGKCDHRLCAQLFARDRRSEGGLQSACKECNKRYRETYRERIQLYKSVYRQEHAQELIEKQSDYYQNHRDQTRQYLQKYYLKAIDFHREQRRQHYLANREQYATLVSAYKRAHPESVQMWNAVRTARKRCVGGDLTPSQWMEVKSLYDHSCLCCGRKEPDVKLSVDHVIPVCKGGKGDASNIQPLCMPCNLRKGTKIIDYRGGKRV